MKIFDTFRATFNRITGSADRVATLHHPEHCIQLLNTLSDSEYPAHKALVVQTLKTPYAIRRLTYMGFGAAALELIREQAADARKEILTAPNVVSELGREGNAHEALELIREQAADARKEILTAPDAVWGLAHGGCGAEVIELIMEQPEEAQAKILAAPGVIATLADNGKAGEVMELIRQQPAEARKEILAAPGAWELEEQGFADELAEIQRAPAKNTFEYPVLEP